MKENAKKLLNDVQKFAQALEQNDFQKAKKFLDEKCVYFIGEQELHGPDAIIRSYQQVFEWSKQKITKTEYSCEVQALSVKRYLIRFTDKLIHRNKEHTYRCQQEVEVNEKNRICKISHKEDPFEKQELEAFLVRMGIA